MQKVRFLGVALFLLAAVVVAGCGGGSSSSSSSGSTSESTSGSTASGGEEGGSINVAMVIGLTSDPFMQLVRSGAEDGTKAVPGAKLTYTGPPEPDPTAEIKMLSDVLSTNPDGVAFMPLQDSLWNRAAQEASEKTSNLLTFNEALPPGSPVKTYVGINDREGADILLEELKKKVGNTDGKIVLGNCIPGVATLDFLVEAYEEGIAEEFPNAEIVGPIETTTEPSKNAANWEGAMEANKEAVAYIGNCDSDGPGMVKAKQQTGVEGQLLTFDIDTASLEGIKDGTMLAAINEAPYVRGYISMRMLAEAAKKGEDIPEGFVNIKPEVVTATNVDEVLERESSPENMQKGYEPYLKKFFADPEAMIEPLGNVYK